MSHMSLRYDEKPLTQLETVFFILHFSTTNAVERSYAVNTQIMNLNRLKQIFVLCLPGKHLSFSDT